jgi:hypothetical protein
MQSTIPMPTTDELASMSEVEFRRYEARLKYAVARTGYRLRKPRGRDYYTLINPDFGFAVWSGMTVGDVIHWLND